MEQILKHPQSVQARVEILAKKFDEQDLRSTELIERANEALRRSREVMARARSRKKKA